MDLQLPRRQWRTLIYVTVAVTFACHVARAQAPATSTLPWQPPARIADLGATSIGPRSSPALDPRRVYSLAELIDLAEQHNPETRVAWQAAKIRASQLRLAQSDLLPTLSAAALANTTRTGTLINVWTRQTIGLFEPVLNVSYTLFDFGQRSDKVKAARQQLIAANLGFNAVHLDILFETSRRYYALLNAMGQQEAAVVNLKNAQMVAQEVEARLKNGLATLPDALEARAAAAQADYEMQAAVGATDIARGSLLDILGASPTLPLQVQPLQQLTVPDHLDEQADAAIERALAQRPDLAAHIAERQAAEAQIKAARSPYLPRLDFQGQGGEVRAYGQQNLLPPSYAGPVEIWNVNLSLNWLLFDGGRREADLAQAHEQERQAQAEIDTTRDEIEQQVWMAYIDLRTAFRQRQAATALLAATQSSYDAAVKAYGYGLRNTVDVVTAQRALAQAMSEDVSAKTNVLTELANFGFRTGDLLQSRIARPHP
jgi:outer membrane protein